jgi:hypothetical protein
MLQLEGTRVKDKGAVLLIVVLAILIVGMAAAALMMVRPTPASVGVSGPPAARVGPDFTVLLARSSNGVTATVTLNNPGTEDLSDLRILRADVATLTGGTPLPLVVGKLARGARTSLVLPYTGPAPAANAPLKLELQYTFKHGMVGNGSGSRDVTATLP